MSVVKYGHIPFRSLFLVSCPSGILVMIVVLGDIEWEPSTFDCPLLIDPVLPEFFSTILIFYRIPAGPGRGYPLPLA